MLVTPLGLAPLRPTDWNTGSNSGGIHPDSLPCLKEDYTGPMQKFVERPLL